jgi:hypothetical protein
MQRSTTQININIDQNQHDMNKIRQLQLQNELIQNNR